MSDPTSPPTDPTDAEDEATRFVPKSAPPTASPLPPAAESGTITPVTPPHAPELVAIRPGVLLGHTYEIEQVLARGGMGEVYRARHAELGSLHAIKVILPELANEPRIISLFQEEARKLRRVRNDAVVAYEGLFRDEYGHRYLVMEFVDGPSLAQVLKQRRLEPFEVRMLRDRIAMGLGAAHEKGIFHRDISPDNIILVDGRTDLAKIIDFGIAKSTEPGDRTVLGTDFAGKYSYVSPEQLGMYDGRVDGRSDIYSLGLVLAAAAIGQPLPMGNSPISVIEARRGVPDLSQVPEELRAEIAPLLEPDPQNRPQSMSELRAGATAAPIAAVSEPPSLDALGLMPPSPPEPAPVVDRSPAGTEKPRRSGVGILVAAGLISFAAAAGAGWYFFLKPNEMVAVKEPAASPPPPPISASPSPPASVSPPPPIVSPPVEPPRPTRAALFAAAQPILAGFQCAKLELTAGDDLKGQIRGFVSSQQDLAGLKSEVRTLPGGQIGADSVNVYVKPHCDVVKALDAATGPGAAPRLELNKPSAVYKNGEKLVVKTVADRDGYLYVDYIDNAGSVVHMLPSPHVPNNRVKAGQEITLGSAKPSARDDAYEIAEPFGPNMLVVLLSPVPLFDKQPQTEEIGPYLQSVQTALARSGGQVTSGFSFFEAVK
ncbi:MAG TPA: serine/threonine-protein kinase [Aliidongia sp.]|nr:serine/threonine-protein kinase [Aliidongia sp.]